MGFCRVRVVVLTAILLVAATLASAEQVPVRFAEGVVHGFLVLRSPQGAQIATGDLIQTAKGDRVTCRLVFHFKDGSLHDETAVFSQRGHFRLLTDRVVQKGPSFPDPLEMSIDTSTGKVTVKYTDDGEPKSETERMDLPPDLANGLIITLLKNVGSTGPATVVSYLAATPKPRLVKLEISSAGTEPFSTAGFARKAVRYVVKVKIGGVEGMLAKWFGKQPPDSHVWILQGEAPAFVKSEAALYLGGPLWRTELTSPVWNKAR